MVSIPQKKGLDKKYWLGIPFLLLLAVAGTLTVSRLITAPEGAVPEPQSLIACEPPYIRHAEGCCLDKNINTICDKDETRTGTGRSKTGSTEDKEREVTTETPSPETPPTTTPPPTSTETSTETSPPADTDDAADIPVSEPETAPAEETSPPPTNGTNGSTTIMVETKCRDSIDNDDDGSVDGYDYDCYHQRCDGTLFNRWIWSYLMPEQAVLYASHSLPPANSAGERRINCCPVTQCTTIDGFCFSYDDIRAGAGVSTSTWVCGDNNNWDKCRSSIVGQQSDGGAYTCAYIREEYEWIME